MAAFGYIGRGEQLWQRLYSLQSLKCLLFDTLEKKKIADSLLMVLQEQRSTENTVRKATAEQKHQKSTSVINLEVYFL